MWNVLFSLHCSVYVFCTVFCTTHWCNQQVRRRCTAAEIDAEFFVSHDIDRHGFKKVFIDHYIGECVCFTVFYVILTDVCLSVCHMLVLYQNGGTCF